MTITINERLKIVCEWKKTRNGFKHEATLYDGTQVLDKAKVNYLNRTWESFEFQTVIKKLLIGTTHLNEKQKDLVLAKAEGRDHEEFSQNMKTVAMVAKMGEVFGQTQKQKNDWKARMLKAGLENYGLIMPADWDSLTEDEKEHRLDGVINELKAK